MTIKFALTYASTDQLRFSFNFVAICAKIPVKNYHFVNFGTLNFWRPVARRATGLSAVATHHTFHFGLQQCLPTGQAGLHPWPIGTFKFLPI